jgi:peptide/nickel transport system substrate-binding protein
MRLKSVWTTTGVLAAVVALATGAQTLPAGAQDATSLEQKVLKIGWAQDPATLNPFTEVNEEGFNVWALNWDLLVNFSPEDLKPVPGIAESWEVSEDEKSVTFKLDPDAKWSDGTPITSTDVKWSLENLGSEGYNFSAYTDKVKSIETPDDTTVVINTTQPDARMVGGLFIYILPEHVWGKVPLDELTGGYQPELPLVGSGPYIVTEFERNRILRMEQNPEWTGETPKFTEVQYVKYGTEDAAERALTLGEVDVITEVQPATFERLGNEPNVDGIRGSTPAYTELAFNLCSEQNCPDAEFNPAVQDQAVRQALAHTIDRERINQISALGTSFVANGILPQYYRTFYETPEQPYAPPDVEQAKQILDDAGWQDNGDEPRTKGDQTLSFDLFVRSESQSDTQAAKLIAEMAREIGVEFKVQVVSADKLTEITIRTVDGEPAPAFDTFVWGWGGDPYDPSFLLSLFLTDQIGGNSDSFYSNPEYDRLFDEQAGAFDVDERREVMAEMVNLTQEDLPYIVLTEDPNLQAYRTDRISDVEQACPADETGDLFCEQISYEPLLSLTPAEESSDEGDGGGGGVVIAVIAVAVVAVAAFLFWRSRRRREGEALELEE